MRRTRTKIWRSFFYWPTHFLGEKKSWEYWTTYALMSHKVPINGTGLAWGERGEVRLFKCCFFSSWWAETVMTVRGSVYNCMCISYLNGISSLFIYRLPWDMYAPWWQRVPGHHWGYFEIPPIPVCLQTIACRVTFFCAYYGTPPWSHLQLTLSDSHFYPRLISQYKSKQVDLSACRITSVQTPLDSSLPVTRSKLKPFFWKYNSWNQKMLNKTKRIERTFSEEGMLVRFLKTLHVYSFSIVTPSIHLKTSCPELADVFNPWGGGSWKWLLLLHFSQDELWRSWGYLRVYSLYWWHLNCLTKLFVIATFLTSISITLYSTHISTHCLSQTSYD